MFSLYVFINWVKFHYGKHHATIFESTKQLQKLKKNPTQCYYDNRLW